MFHWGLEQNVYILLMLDEVASLTSPALDSYHLALPGKPPLRTARLMVESNYFNFTLPNLDI